MIGLHYELMRFNPSNKGTRGITRTAEAYKLIEFICTEMGLYSPTSLRQKTRKREVVECRQVCMWIIKKKTNLNVTQIADLFNKDHSTVIFGIKQINNFIDIDYKLGNTAKSIL